MSESLNSDTNFISALRKEYPQFSSKDGTTVRVPAKLIMGIARSAVGVGVVAGVKVATDQFNSVIRSVNPQGELMPAQNELTEAEIITLIRQAVEMEES